MAKKQLLRAVRKNDVVYSSFYTSNVLLIYYFNYVLNFKLLYYN